MEARWIALAGGIVVESIAGSPYGFGVWSTQLKAQLNYTQNEIETVGSIGNLGQYTAIFAGFAFDAWGPRITGLIGGVLSIIGYGMLWSVSANKTPHPLAATASWAFLAYMGSSWFDTMAICSASRNFPSEKGLVIGLTKSLYGLSASLLTTCYQNLFIPDVTSYLGFLAILIPVVGVGFGMLVSVVRNRTLITPLLPVEKGKVAAGYVGIVIIAAYVAAVGILHSTDAIGKDAVFAYVIIPLVLMQLLLMVPVRGCGKRSGTIAAEKPDLLLNGGETSLTDSNVSRGLAAHDTGATLVTAMLSLDFWLFFGILVVGTGAGLTVINNVSSLTQSLGGSQSVGDLLVTLTSIANCVGRMVGGILSDSFAKRLHRPGWLAINIALMTVAQIALALSPLQFIYPGVLLSGFCYGAFWSLGPSFLSDRFGVRAFGAINSLSAFSTALSTYIFSVGMAATLYQQRIAPGGGTVCMGHECFDTSFTVLAVLCAVVALPLAVWLALRTRQFYDERGGSRPYDDIEALSAEAPWKITTRRRCLGCCGCLCGAWGRGLAVAPEEQATYGNPGWDSSIVGSSWDEDGLHGLLRSNGVVLQ